MSEIILTYRRDFSEQTVGCYATREEAQAVAAILSVQHAKDVVRAWVRQVREAKTEFGNSESKEKTDS